MLASGDLSMPEIVLTNGLFGAKQSRLTVSVAGSAGLACVHGGDMAVSTHSRLRADHSVFRRGVSCKRQVDISALRRRQQWLAKRRGHPTRPVARP